MELLWHSTSQPMSVWSTGSLCAWPTGAAAAVALVQAVAAVAGAVRVVAGAAAAVVAGALATAATTAAAVAIKALLITAVRCLNRSLWPGLLQCRCSHGHCGLLFCLAVTPTAATAAAAP
eukprot:9180-Pelagomonas_calceolata.AAC.1